MNRFYALAVALSAFVATPAAAATTFQFDEANSFVNVTSNPTNCVLLGNCALTASLATPFQSFTLDVGESRTFDFARFVISRGIGTGSATVDAQLAFLMPTAGPAGSGAAASYFRLGGLFTPGITGGSLTWNTPFQQLTAANGASFSVAFGNRSGAQFGGNVLAPVTITLLSNAVPEPGTWALMIGGFGMVGGAMRLARRRAHLQLSAA